MLYVSLPYATFALILREGRVIDAPPIARWTIGKGLGQVAEYYGSKDALMITTL